MTPAVLVASDIVSLEVGSGADAFVAAGLGMLLPTTILSPGHFLARRELPVAGMFGVLVALTVLALAAVVTA